MSANNFSKALCERFMEAAKTFFDECEKDITQSGLDDAYTAEIADLRASLERRLDDFLEKIQTPGLSEDALIKITKKFTQGYVRVLEETEAEEDFASFGIWPGSVSLAIRGFTEILSNTWLVPAFTRQQADVVKGGDRLFGKTDPGYLRKLNAFKAEVLSFEQQIIASIESPETLYAEEEVSLTVSPDEWAHAKKKLAPGGVLLPDGTKLRRKDEDNPNEHSFLIINQRIIALAGKGDYLGLSVKLGLDESGGVWAIKRRRIWPSNMGNVLSEASTAYGLKVAMRWAQRVKHDGMEVCYIPYVYLGQTLEKFLVENPELPEEDRFNLAISLLDQLIMLHDGDVSRGISPGTFHCDLHGANITVDQSMHVHIIDFDCAKIENRYLAEDKRRVIDHLEHILLEDPEVRHQHHQTETVVQLRDKLLENKDSILGRMQRKLENPEAFDL